MLKAMVDQNGASLKQSTMKSWNNGRVYTNRVATAYREMYTVYVSSTSAPVITECRIIQRNYFRSIPPVVFNRQ
jgi:hypothetical protein